MWQLPRDWKEPPSGRAAAATVACGVPYLVMLLLAIASSLPVTLATGFARNVVISLAVAFLLELIAAVSAARTARRSGLVADRTLAGLCMAGAVAYIPLAAVTGGIAYALAGD